jgi:hypothetical protein
MGKKKGPKKYDTSKLDNQYLLIHKPWGLGPGKSARDYLATPDMTDQAATLIAAWVRAMFNKPKLEVESVFMTGGKVCV